MTVLNIENLSIEYETDVGSLSAVDSVDIALQKGEILGIVGESGCGKSTLLKSIPGLLPKNGTITQGRIELNGQDLAPLSDEELNAVRWSDISLVMQSAMNALDPVYRIGSQFREVIQEHTEKTNDEAKARTKELLEAVDIDPSRRNDYPHELSGGQRQRVIIALALALEPDVILADEPTTGLDVIVQDQIIDLLKRIQDELNCSVIVVTHDISVIAELVDRVAVMYGGQIVEVGDLEDVFNRSTHPYTIGLQNAFPSLGEIADLVEIPGTPPDLINAPEGCRFKERCPFATEECSSDPPIADVNEGHSARCHYIDDAEEFRNEGKKREVWQ